MLVGRKPIFRIWVEGYPHSFQRRNRKALKEYIELIRNAASQVVPYPTKSKRIDIEIWFRAETSLRADVDNIIKPILDGLKGIVYLDDGQVRSIKATALPTDDVFSISGWTSKEVLLRLAAHPPKEFLINIFHGIGLEGGPGV